MGVSSLETSVGILEAQGQQPVFFSHMSVVHFVCFAKSSINNKEPSQATHSRLPTSIPVGRSLGAVYLQVYDIQYHLTWAFSGSGKALTVRPEG